MIPESEHRQEWKEYVHAFPNGEDVLACVRLWLDYLGDGRGHWGMRRRSFVMAKRLLHVVASGESRRVYTLGKLWKERLSEFGLKWYPETNEVEIIDQWRWMHALSIMRQLCFGGRTNPVWTIRLPYRYFLQRIGSGCHYDDPINFDDFPPKTKSKLLKHAPRVYHQKPQSHTELPQYVPPPVTPNPIQRFLWKITEEM